MILFIMALMSTIICFVSTLNILKWRRRRVFAKSWYPGISILKPVRGLEPELETNLHSFFNLKQTIPFEILFSVKNSEDPCLPIIRKLMELHPDVTARLFLDSPDLGRNPKISNMHVSWNHAAHDLVLISDSNVRVEPDYLEVLIAERQRGAGLVTQAVYGVGAQTLAGHLDVIHLNTFYLKATGFLNIFGFPCVLGKCMLFSRGQFERIGGLFSLRNYLAEDLVAGEMMKEAGYVVKVAPALLRQTTIMRQFKAYWNRHVRWARLRKCHYLHAYLFEPLFFETLWPVLLFTFAQSRLQQICAVACVFVQIVSNVLLHYFKFKDREAWKSLPWFWLKDIVAPVVWLAGLSSNWVNWRGQSLQLRWGGKLGSKYLREARRRKLVKTLRLSRVFRSS